MFRSRARWQRAALSGDKTLCEIQPLLYFTQLAPNLIEVGRQSSNVVPRHRTIANPLGESTAQPAAGEEKCAETCHEPWRELKKEHEIKHRAHTGTPNSARFRMCCLTDRA